MLSITREQFRAVYHDTEVLKYEEVFYSTPKDKEDLLGDYMTSKLWRLNHVYKIIDANAEQIVFKMRLSQHKIYADSLRHSRRIILKSRQQGISTLWLISFFDDAVFLGNMNVGLMAQGTDESEKLLSRNKYLWENIDPDVKRFLGITITKDNMKEISFNNNSSIFIRTSFRSTTLQRLHISEFGKIANAHPKRAEETLTGTLQAATKADKAIIVIESTAEGDNIFKTMWDNAVMFSGTLTKFDFAPSFLSWADDPDCVSVNDQDEDAQMTKYFSELEAAMNITLTKEQRNFYIAKHRELGTKIVQEYPGTAEEAFMKNRAGTYYADLYHRLIKGRDREVENLFDPNLPVQVAADLGYNDLFVLVFFQTYTDGFRIINEYHINQKQIKDLCEVMDEMKNYHNYTYGRLCLPHDANVIELGSEEHLSREKVFWKYGYRNTYVVPLTNNIGTDREMVKEAMDKMWIDTRCKYLKACFLNYSKEWDDRRQIFREKHLHDKYSHGADAIRCMVKGAMQYMESTRRKSYEGMDV